MQLGHVFLGVPLVDAVGKELLVLFVGVVDGVEEVLQVVKTYQTDFIGLLLLGLEA